MAEDWNDTFYDLFREAVGRYHEGHRNVDGFFTDVRTFCISFVLTSANVRASTTTNLLS